MKDRIVKWFIINLVISRQEIMDRPGYIATKVTGKGSKFYLREIFLPEIYFEKLENNISTKYKEKGKHVLYSIGKRFGYRYAQISEFPSVLNKSRKEVSTFFSFLTKYLECVYANRIDCELNFEKKSAVIRMKDYACCRHNGRGYILADGAFAGIISYIFNDKTIEGVQTKCQGRGDDECVLICGPPSFLDKEKKGYFKQTKMDSLELSSDYFLYNKLYKTKARYSIIDMIKHGIFSQRGGIIKYNDCRLIGIEASILYIIEKEIARLSSGSVIYDISLEVMNELIKDENDKESFLSEFLPALGFGELNYIKHKMSKEIICNFYPWTKYIPSHHFLTLKGFIAAAHLPDKIHFSDKTSLIHGYVSTKLVESPI